MDAADVKDAVATLASAIVGEGWVRVVCPACLATDGKRRDNLAINLDTGFYQCWRCGVRGGINDKGAVSAYAQAHRTLERLREERELPSVPLPDGFVALADPELAGHPEASKALRFLLRRGVSVETAHEAGVGVVVGRRKYADRAVVPVTIDGRVCGFTARLYVKPEDAVHSSPFAAAHRLDGVDRERARKTGRPAPYYLGDATSGEVPKYVYPKGMSRLAMLNRDALKVVTTEPAFLVEGAMDALPHWPNAVAFLGKPTEKQTRWICDNARRPVVVTLDGDAWREGMAAAKDMVALGGVHVGFLRLPPRRDPGDIKPDELSSLLGSVVWF